MCIQRVDSECMAYGNIMGVMEAVMVVVVVRVVREDLAWWRKQSVNCKERQHGWILLFCGY